MEFRPDGQIVALDTIKNNPLGKDGNKTARIGNGRLLDGNGATFYLANIKTVKIKSPSRLPFNRGRISAPKNMEEREPSSCLGRLGGIPENSSKKKEASLA